MRIIGDDPSHSVVISPYLRESFTHVSVGEKFNPRTSSKFPIHIHGFGPGGRLSSSLLCRDLQKIKEESAKVAAITQKIVRVMSMPPSYRQLSFELCLKITENTGLTSSRP